MNVFELLGLASECLRLTGRRSEIKEMTDRVTSCHSYEDAISIMQEYVPIIENGLEL